MVLRHFELDLFLYMMILVGQCAIQVRGCLLQVYGMSFVIEKEKTCDEAVTGVEDIHFQLVYESTAQEKVYGLE